MTNIHEIPVQTHTFEPSEHFDALVKAMDAADICALEVGITEMWDVSFPPTLWTAGADNTLGLKFKAPEETDGLGADLFQALGKFSLFPYPLNGLASFPLEKIGGPYRTAWLFGGGLVVTETEISDLFKASRFSNTHLKTLGENFALLVPAVTQPTEKCTPSRPPVKPQISSQNPSCNRKVEGKKLKNLRLGN